MAKEENGVYKWQAQRTLSKNGDVVFDDRLDTILKDAENNTKYKIMPSKDITDNSAYFTIIDLSPHNKSSSDCHWGECGQECGGYSGGGCDSNCMCHAAG